MKSKKVFLNEMKDFYEKNLWLDSILKIFITKNEHDPEMFFLKKEESIRKVFDNIKETEEYKSFIREIVTYSQNSFLFLLKTKSNNSNNEILNKEFDKLILNLNKNISNVAKESFHKVMFSHKVFKEDLIEFQFNNLKILNKLNAKDLTYPFKEKDFINFDISEYIELSNVEKLSKNIYHLIINNIEQETQSKVPDTYKKNISGNMLLTETSISEKTLKVLWKKQFENWINSKSKEELRSIIKYVIENNNDERIFQIVNVMDAENKDVFDLFTNYIYEKDGLEKISLEVLEKVFSKYKKNNEFSSFLAKIYSNTENTNVKNIIVGFLEYRRYYSELFDKELSSINKEKYINGEKFLNIENKNYIEVCFNKKELKQMILNLNEIIILLQKNYSNGDSKIYVKSNNEINLSFGFDITNNKSIDIKDLEIFCVKHLMEIDNSLIENNGKINLNNLIENLSKTYKEFLLNSLLKEKNIDRVKNKI